MHIAKHEQENILDVNYIVLEQEEKNMNTDKIKKLLQFYLLATELKDKIR